MKVLIFTEEKVGEGHYQAANALKKAFEKDLSNVQVKLVYGLRCIHPLIEWIVVKFYFFILHYFPFIWKWMYIKTKKSSFIQTHFFAFRLMKLIKEENPSIIICTHPSCIPALSLLKRKGLFQFRLGVVTTDFDFHPSVPSSQIDYFFVAHDQVKQKLIKQFHIPSSKVFDYGIPLRDEFDLKLKNVKPKESKKKYQILVVGGSTGYGPIEKIIKTFEPFEDRYSLTVITGKNKELYHQIKQRNSPHVKLLGYVNNMEEWVQYADLVITKPGGLTISEIIACGTPFIIIDPIPGHEEANARFLEEQRLGIVARDIPSLPYQVQQLMENTQNLREWKKRIIAQQKKNSARHIVTTITQQTY